MAGLMLTPYSGAILGPIARVLGILLNTIFNVVPNVGVAIILFTFVIYLVLLPLTYQQQKFSKLSAKMNPELQAIQAKYKDKRDQESVARQNEEMQLVYKKYGVSPTGSCLQLAIQMPILFALYRVIYSVPAYVGKVYTCLEQLASNINSAEGGLQALTTLSITQKGEYAKYVVDGKFVGKGDSIVNSIIDILNRAPSADWKIIEGIKGLDAGVFETVRSQFEQYYTFLGLNIAYSPINIMKEALVDKNYLLIVGAAMVPILAAATQWVNFLFMPQSAAAGNNSSASMMKSMNITMPVVSAVFCLTLPCGMGIYWIAGAVIRSIMQVIINHRIDKMDIDALIEKNLSKEGVSRAKSAEASSASGSSISSNASMRTSSISAKAHSSNLSEQEREEAIKKAEAYYKKNAKVGGIASKANLVKDYNERNSKK
ncbi:YidC/Oxa1 family membrane protein insertase [Lachnospiraceae bacterium]|nr:YidC/Oxa1 family membrane protein insertase [Lachnospiraceae bacterium]